MSDLALRRLHYSAMPWRLVRTDAQGQRHPIAAAGVWWQRKHDGLPTLRALQALGLSWQAPEAWTPAERAAVAAVLQPLIDAEQGTVTALHAQQQILALLTEVERGERSFMVYTSTWE